MDDRRLERCALGNLAVVSGAILLLLVAVRGAWAQAAPTVGVIAADRTPIYAGGGPTFYIVGYLNKGDKVEVRAVEFDWYRITPPAGSCSYIAKAQVAQGADRKTGTVTAPADVRAASPDGADPKTQSYRIHARLKKGDTVTILGEVGAYYRIATPGEASLYLTPDALQGAAAPAPVAPVHPVTPAPVATPVRDQPAAAPAPRTPEARSAAPVIPVAPAVTPTPAPSVVAEIGPVPANPPALVAPTASVSFAALDEQYKTGMALPLDQQPLEALLKGYKDLLATPDLSPSQSRVAAYRVKVLERNTELAEALHKIVAARAEAEAPATQPTMANPSAAKMPDYDAVGQLMASTVYDGARLPRLFRVVDPPSGRTIAYLHPTVEIDPALFLGRVVGIVGEIKDDAELKLPMIEPKRIDALEPAAAAARATP